MPEQNLKVTAESLILDFSGTPYAGVVEKVNKNYDRRRNSRDRSFKYFGHSPQGEDRNVVQYVSDNQLRFNAYKFKADWKEDWQSNYVDPLTHDKVIAILAKLSGQLFKSEFHPKNDLSVIAEHRAQIFEGINDYNETVLSSRDKDTFMRMMEAAVAGTVIVFEDYENWETQQTVIKKYNPVTGNIDFEEKTILLGGLVSEIVPIEEFYPDNIWENDNRKRKGCTWVQKMHRDDFEVKFKKWPNADKVLTHGEGGNTPAGEGSDQKSDFNEIQPHYDEYVTLIRDFDAVDNQYYITANNIPLTPKDNPMRWKPGRIPFALSGYQPFSSKFWAFRSLVHGLENVQDGIDALFNLFIDRSVLATMRPLIVGDLNDEADDQYGPGTIFKVKDATQTREMAIQEPGNSLFAAISRMQGSADQSAMDTISSGVAGAGTAKTATEVERAQQSANQILALFRRCMNWLEQERSELRAYNIGQYYTRPQEITKAIGEDGVAKMNTAFAQFVIPKSRILTERGVEQGTKIIEMKPTRMELSPIAELRRRNGLIKGPSEIIQLTPDYLRDFDMDVRIVESPEYVVTSSLQRILDRQFAATALSMPNIFNQSETAKRFAKAMNQPETLVIVGAGQQTMGEEGKPMSPAQIDQGAFLSPVADAI